MEQRTSRVLKWSLIIGIVIVLNLFFNYSLSTIYHSPQYDEYCKDTQIVQSPTTQQECLAVGGQWSLSPSAPTNSTGPAALSGYCNPTYTCQNNYQSATDAYNRNVFITLVALGVIVVVLSFILKNNEVLSFSFAFAGVLSLLIASIRYWSSANSLVKIFILAVALAVLIYLAYKKFSPSDEKLRS